MSVLHLTIFYRAYFDEVMSLVSEDLMYLFGQFLEIVTIRLTLISIIIIHKICQARFISVHGQPLWNPIILQHRISVMDASACIFVGQKAWNEPISHKHCLLGNAAQIFTGICASEQYALPKSHDCWDTLCLMAQSLSDTSSISCPMLL